MARLQRDFGRWKVPWEINRYQRISAIDHPFQRQRAERPGAVRLWQLRFMASSNAARAMAQSVRHERQQLRRGGRVRRLMLALSAPAAKRRSVIEAFNDQAARYAPDLGRSSIETCWATSSGAIIQAVLARKLSVA
jgi:hypothetical protein